MDGHGRTCDLYLFAMMFNIGSCWRAAADNTIKLWGAYDGKFEKTFEVWA
jgi:hypothetical protein